MEEYLVLLEYDDAGFMGNRKFGRDCYWFAANAANETEAIRAAVSETYISPHDGKKPRAIAIPFKDLPKIYHLEMEAVYNLKVTHE